MRQAMRSVRLAGPADVAAFRQAARGLLAQGVAPEAVQWIVESDGATGESAGLFEEGAGPPSVTPQAPAGPMPPVTVPRAFVDLTEAAALHSQPQRHALLYRLLWRLQHEPALRHDPLDADWLHAEQLAREVRREVHKMHAYVRFRPLDRGAAKPPLHVAWFEPEHHTVEAAAPFFVRRFANLEWRLLTPRRSAAWDGERLALGPGASRADAPPADAGETLWLTYYEHIFNPARLKLATMQREMPRRYWNNLPEAVLIAPLAADAHQRSSDMIDKAPTAPRRRRTVSGSESVEPGGLTTLGTAAAEGASATVGPLPAPDPAAPPDARRAALQATQEAARGCTGCPLYAHATQTVFGAGPVDAGLMFVGEQPGDQEDLRGAPFVGPAGQLFDRALAELQVDRAQVYVTNAVKHFKFEMRGTRRLHKSPGQQEAAACLDWLEREIALVQPNAIVALGATAARSLMGRPVPVTRERGQWLVRPDGVRVLITLHPSALLRMQPEDRAAAYRDWLADLAKAVPTPP